MPIDPRRIEVMDDMMADILRRKTPQEKMSIAAGMWRAARRMVAASVQHRNPFWSVEEVNGEVTRRMSRGTG